MRTTLGFFFALLAPCLLTAAEIGPPLAVPHLEWLHTGRDWTWRATIQDLGEDFRADPGFVT